MSYSSEELTFASPVVRLGVPELVPHSLQLLLGEWLVRSPPQASFFLLGLI